MKLIALILGLGLERLATRFPHLRELRWLDPYFDIGMARLRGANVLIVYLGILILLSVPAIPVYWASSTLIGAGILWDLPYLLFAVLGVFFCLGPRDLASEVEIDQDSRGHASGWRSSCSMVTCTCLSMAS